MQRPICLFCCSRLPGFVDGFLKLKTKEERVQLLEKMDPYVIEELVLVCDDICHDRIYISRHTESKMCPEWKILQLREQLAKPMHPYAASFAASFGNSKEIERKKLFLMELVECDGFWKGIKTASYAPLYKKLSTDGDGSRVSEESLNRRKSSSSV